jgi:hypothetical protein
MSRNPDKPSDRKRSQSRNQPADAGAGGAVPDDVDKDLTSGGAQDSPGKDEPVDVMPQDAAVTPDNQKDKPQDTSGKRGTTPPVEPPSKLPSDKMRFRRRRRV